METGRKYRIRFKQQTGNYRWVTKEFVAKVFAHEGDVYWVHGRPVFDTFTITESEIVETTEVPADTRPSPPRKVKVAL